ncbi:related to GYP5 - GTPase-activating protein for Ypt Proteins [Ustilago bromivora]|uniref:Related to GYP5 - GTPase-activating protein for Ypt Proteins n=2 Tax=Ustilago bromivora TaxID=307758 RepID=A0A8H8QN52_9BASI|nr:related to GYP5 - GTPase-activating protein for Ypt Proteins [Ustilago bromivora]
MYTASVQQQPSDHFSDNNSLRNVTYEFLVHDKMTTDHHIPAEASVSANKGKEGHKLSGSRSLRALPARFRPKTAPTTLDPSEDRSTSTLAPPIPVSPRIRRSSAPEEGSQIPEWHANQFSTPLESDAEFVRRTYAHFAVAGVPDDGFADGKEYTREKNGLSAWEEAALSRPNNTIAARSSARPSETNTSAPTTPGHSGVENVPNGGINGHNIPAIDGSGSARSGLLQWSSQGGHSPRPPLPTSFSAATSVSNNTLLSTNERQRRQEIAGKKREQLIANIDRYGFFSDSPSNAHHKSTLLSSSLFAAPFPKKGTKGLASQRGPLPTSLTPPHSSASNTATRAQTNGSDQFGSHLVQEARAAADTLHRRREQERIAKWSKMLTVKGRDQGHNAVHFDFAKAIDQKLRRRVYKGIPDSWRAAAWAALIQHRQQTEEGRYSNSLAQPHLQGPAASTPVSLSKPDPGNLEKLADMPSAHDVQIDLDVPRTISGHIQFHTRYGQGQRSLFHILHAISMLCEQCGYCQGMGPIAATLLCYFSPERAYTAMVSMHNYLNLHTTFSPGFPGLVENLFVQEQLLRKYAPELAAVFDDQMIVASSYATKWYITLFSNSIPFETQLRVWDAWLLDGQDVITMVAVGIIWAHRGVVLAEGADFEMILSALSSFFVPEDDDALLFWVRDALARKDVRMTIKNAREEYRGKVRDGEASGLML